MKISVSHASFKKVVKDLNTSIKLSGVTVPMLENVKISAYENDIKLTVSNADISIVKSLPLNENIEVNETGTIVINFKDLNKYISKLKSKDVVIEYNEKTLSADNQAAIKLDNTSINLNSLSPSNYPGLPSLRDESKIMTLEPNELINGMNTIIKDVGKLDSRPILKAACITYDSYINSLVMVATDSHRLGRYALDNVKLHNGYKPDEISITFMLELLHKAKKQFDTSEPLDVYNLDDVIAFKQKNTAVYVRSVAGEYPDTARLIPNESNLKMIVNKSEIKEALDIAKMFNKDTRNNVTKLAIDETVQLSSDDMNLNKDLTTDLKDFTVINNNGVDGFEISFNPSYLLDSVNSLDHEKLLLDFTTDLRPFLLTPVDNKKSLQLVTPVRTF